MRTQVKLIASSRNLLNQLFLCELICAIENETTSTDDVGSEMPGRGNSDIEERLDESELRLKLAIRAAGIGIWDWDILSGKMTYSPRARSIFGFSPEDSITIEMVREATHPDDLPRTSAMSRRALDPAIRDKQPFEYRLLHRRTGETRWVLAHGDAIFAKVDGSLKAVRFLGTIEDITDRKTLEQKLLDADVTRILAFEAARMAVWEFDIVNEELSVTNELKALFGFRVEEHPTLEDFRNCYLPGQREILRETAETALAECAPNFSAEFKIGRPDDTERWMLLKAQFVAGAEGAPTRIVGVVIDIDDRKRAEQQQQIMLRIFRSWSTR